MINANTMEVKAKQKEAKHKEKLQLYHVFLGVVQALWEKVMGAVDTQWISALDEDYVEYLEMTPILML